MADKRFVYAGTTGARPIVFPIRISLESLIAGSLQIVNNTGATLYLSRTVPTPTALNCDVPIPPRVSLAIAEWRAAFVNIGSDGTAISALDTLTVEARSEADSPLAGTAIPVGLGSQVRTVQRDIVAHGVIASGAASVIDYALATPVNPAKAIEFNQGVSASGGPTSGSIECRLQLLNATTIRSAVINRTLSNLDCNHGYTVLELV